ncbi:MAG: hypothetical protein Kow00128_18570 [Deltaproteobacteria bacterium]
MRTVLRKSAVGAFAASMFLAAGCGVNTKFVYKPDPPIQGTPKLPVKVAVLPFADGTENFTQRGSIFDPEHLTFNLARTGMYKGVDAITPELWAKMFAEDLAASGIFRSARFVFGPSEIAGEDLLVDGTVLKADLSGSILKPSHFALALRARRKTDDGVVWEKRVESIHTRPNGLGFYDGCGLGIQCRADREQAEIHKMVKAMFAEARADLVRTIAAGYGATEPAVAPREGALVGPKGAAPAAETSVDETIERILKEK